jgi:hypothetical protein
MAILQKATCAIEGERVMKIKGKSRLFWCGLAIIFLLALLPRLIYPVSQYMLWYKRSVRFWDALLAGNFAATYQQYHPGVTTMWVAGLGLQVYKVTHGWSPEELLEPPPMMAGPQGEPARMGVAALSLLIAGCIALVYVLLDRLTDWPVAFSAGCLLALDPFHITHSKLIHVDGLLASLMLVSALFLIVYLQEDRHVHLILSGVFTGLAFLTKSPAAFLIPYAALLIALHQLVCKRSVPGEAFEAQSWSRHLWKAGRSLGLWGFVAICTFFLLWPAMWVTPGKTLSAVGLNAQMHADLPHPTPVFFAGRVVDGDPGPLYYLASLAWKTTLISLPASCAAILFLLWQRKDGAGERRRPLWYVLIYAGGFLLMMTLADKKWSRYILPTFAALDVVAAWGLVQVANVIGSQGALRKRTWIPTTLVTVALITQAVTVLRHHPYYGTHHNLLLGGSRAAQHILHLGDQGEGLDLAARFLNGRPGAERIKVGAQHAVTDMLQDNFVGRVKHLDQPDVDYWIFFVGSMQRQSRNYWGDLWDTCQQMKPVWSYSFDGVPYVWIYRAYPHTPERLDIDHRLDVQLGGHIRLLGYRLSESDVTAGDVLTVTLFWQSDAPLSEDDHVFVHLIGTDGVLVNQQDGIPRHGERPTWTWQEEEILEDEHALVIDDSVPDDMYSLSVGMYEFTSMTRLPAVGPDGDRLADDRIVLQYIHVISSP